jgi:ribosomal protein L37AE/L43A
LSGADANLSDGDKKTRAPDGFAWTLEPHVCRKCFARVVSRETLDDADRVYHCTNCGATEVGESPAVMCSCGTQLRRLGKLIDAGIRCQPNPSPSLEFPSLIVAATPVE